MKTEIKKSLTEKIKFLRQYFYQNKNPNRKSNILLARNEHICNTKISRENEHHREHSSLLAKENNKDTVRKNDEKEKLKLDNGAVKRP